VRAKIILASVIAIFVFFFYSLGFTVGSMDSVLTNHSVPPQADSKSFSLKLSTQCGVP